MPADWCDYRHCSMIGEFEFPRILATPRLELRAYGSGDAPAVLALISRNREQLRRNFAPMALKILQPTDATDFVDECSRKRTAGTEFVYGIWLESSKQLVGQIKVKSIVWDIPAAELSYFICASSQRMGLASEAVASVAQAAIRQLHFKRISLRIIASNAASLQLADKLGFEREGLHRREFRCGFDELHDVFHYSLTSEDPLPRTVRR
jgi:ribosomal-protein-alanine N-acetyltransferase